MTGTASSLLTNLYAAPSVYPAAQLMTPEVQWHVAYPIETCLGPDAVRDRWLDPLRTALPDIERRPYIAFDGTDGWSAGTGYFVGTFTAPLFGIPATGKTLYLRYTELLRSESGRLVEVYLIPDFLDAMAQAGVYPLRPPLGHHGLMPPPRTLDGTVPRTKDTRRSEGSVQLVMDMLDGLRAYDGKSLQSMDLARYWHEDFMWYGPGGIGTTRGITGFRAHHQGPFLTAFPDRDVDHHACTVASGDYVATGGWPHMHGTHSGGGWLGLPPSGRYLELRVMDIWRREGDLLKENWVAIDICHMLAQMGLDVFAQMHALCRGGKDNG
ncbi:MAG: ester cyclase [Pseudomonadota bacterium]